MTSTPFPECADVERAAAASVPSVLRRLVSFDVLKWIGAVVLAVALALDGIGV
jgi:hypothetical protein